MEGEGVRWRGRGGMEGEDKQVVIHAHEVRGGRGGGGLLRARRFCYRHLSISEHLDFSVSYKQI